MLVCKVCRHLQTLHCGFKITIERTFICCHFKTLNYGLKIDVHGTLFCLNWSEIIIETT